MPNAVAPLSGVTPVEADTLFYVASVFEARVNEFIAALDAMPEITSLSFDRGYQRLDGTEPFGFKDGVRNIRRSERPDVVYVDCKERHLEEPAWTDGGSYMAFLKIQQHPHAFAAVGDETAQAAIIGRKKDGTRADLDSVDPKNEPAEPPPNLAASAHVRKAGPRSKHDDVQIFRRGLPFLETSPDGQPRVGLAFCSFQGSLDQFDVVFNDWVANPRFPVEGAGVDALLDPARQFTTIEKGGFFFVPPHDDEGLVTAVFKKQPKPRRPKTGRLVVRKRVVDPNDPSKRFERGGFTFQVVNAQGQPVGAQFTSDSTGRAVCPEELTIGETYSIQETPVPDRQFEPVQFTMERRRQQVRVRNLVTNPVGPYS
jgi:Dyp-type peroxidase family